MFDCGIFVCRAYVTHVEWVNTLMDFTVQQAVFSFLLLGETQKSKQSTHFK
jgi:hypothetical protein